MPSSFYPTDSLQYAMTAARLEDGGPIYTETDVNRLIVEPWNALSALLFLGIVAYWLVRLWGRYPRYPFLSVSLPILAAGGLGGTLYHATRSSYAFFLLDVTPIVILGLATSLFLWTRVLPRWWYGLVLLLPYFLVQRLGFFYLQTHMAINLSYAVLAVTILLPAVIFLLRTGLRHGGWILLAVCFFLGALFFRYADAWSGSYLPMGTHWLWHVGGAGASWALSEFLYRIEGST